MEKMSAITNVCNNKMMVNKLRPVIRSKHRGLSSKQTTNLLHENARQHTTAHTVLTSGELGFELLIHPVCNPDLFPSNYEHFRPLELLPLELIYNDIILFTTDEKALEMMHKWSYD